MTKDKNLSGRELHHQIEAARESDNLSSALELGMQSLLAYAQENDQLGFAEALDSIFITFKHLHRQQKFKPYWILAGAIVKSSVEIAEDSGDKQALALPQLNLAEFLEESGELEPAKEMYQKAVHSMTNYPSPEHNRPAVLALMKLRLALCELALGDQTAMTAIESLLAELAADTGVDADYNCKVWISGGYLRLAEHFKGKNFNLAHEYLQQAQEIIENDERLVLRRQQLDEMLGRFS
ncbi:MAG: hypothetical protein HN846_05110 [Candidatus Pacebacteria bacterium]|nr:hypothetical protein [Candidatus Paceibacterota bacterium]MBT3512050.1 hypothetical protein [Candidatus Paceibacterota bacterium]MBT4004480.1 hypothetical protein [Candidatus Paceibacterota bacterium]MBT4359081.1 hypothetical protein [Candidatus Paceibacterota bacterium]MBT4681376.1 hypothetical protein [Candidatus Paceibacterota bacterium]